jgi:hypothetical protein
MPWRLISTSPCLPQSEQPDVPRLKRTHAISRLYKSTIGPISESEGSSLARIPSALPSTSFKEDPHLRRRLEETVYDVSLFGPFIDFAKITEIINSPDWQKRGA